MPLRNFFKYGNRGGRRVEPSVLTPKDKEHLIKVRNQIFTAFNGDEPTQAEIRDTTPVSDLTDAGAVGDITNMASVFSHYIYSSERNKTSRLETYREMAKYPEISFAVDEYVDAAVNENSDDGHYIELLIRDQDLNENDNQRKTLLAEFNRVMNEIVNADYHLDQWFREFMIDGEIFFENVIDNSDQQLGLISVKKLMTTRTHPIWKDLESDKILFYAYQTDDDNLINLQESQVAYANSGIYAWSREEDMKIVLSVLESAKVTYKRLKLLEDALVIYRIVRAPERRVFKIDVGNLPKGRADQFMQEMIRRYRQRKFFNSATGDVDEGLDMIAMTEDFWFPVFQGGRSSDVTSLPGGQGLGEVADVDYFLKKLYRGLKIPQSRWGEQNRFSIGDTSGEITREEDKFHKQVKRFSKRFALCFKQIFLTHLKLRGIADEYGVSDKTIEVKLNSNWLFERFMEAKILELQFQNFSYFSELIDTEQPLFSRKWVTQKYLGISEEDWKQNIEMITAETGENGEIDDEEDGDGEDEFDGINI